MLPCGKDARRATYANAVTSCIVLTLIKLLLLIYVMKYILIQEERFQFMAVLSTGNHSDKTANIRMNFDFLTYVL